MRVAHIEVEKCKECGKRVVVLVERDGRFAHCSCGWRVEWSSSGNYKEVLNGKDGSCSSSNSSKR